VSSGGVLTAFVGVDGLMYQLASDRCLPAVFLRKNASRGTNHFIIVTFLVLCLLLVLLMDGKVDGLAGVYSLAFLCVMSSFALGAALLKVSTTYAPQLEVRHRTPLTRACTSSTPPHPPCTMDSWT
jgi:amino acid transporter